MLKKLLFLCIALAPSFAGYCQNFCGTDMYNQRLFIDHPQYKQQYNDNGKPVDAAKNINACSNLTVQVVFHVVYNPNNPEQQIGNTQISQAMATLNQDYNRQNPDAIYTGNAGAYISAFDGLLYYQDYDTYAGNPDINFCLAGVTYDATSNAGYQVSATNYNQGADAYYVKNDFPHAEYPSTEYLKVWVCNLTDFVGYATFPGAPEAYDGVTLRYTSIGNSDLTLRRALTHEIGHWFGLRHIWGDAQCGDDFVGDTQPAPGPSSSGNTSCTYGMVQCANTNYGYPYVPMFDNYMDYSPGNCQNFFSIGQSARMWSFIDSYRPNLCNISPTACQPQDISNTISTQNVPAYFFQNSLYPYPNIPLNTLYDVTIYNTTGAQVHHCLFANNPVDLSFLANGAYIALFSTSTGNQSKTNRLKFIKD